MVVGGGRWCRRPRRGCRGVASAGRWAPVRGGGVPCGRTLGVALRGGGEPLLYPPLTRARAREVRGISPYLQVPRYLLPTPI